MLGIALLAYDSVLTLSEDVSYVWKKKWKLGTALYVLARYPMPLLCIGAEIIGFFFNFPSQVCFFHDFHWHIIYDIVIVVSQDHLCNTAIYSV